VRTGERVRLELRADANTATVLQAALRAGASIVSFNPVKLSLEDYFVTKVESSGPGAGKAGVADLTAPGAEPDTDADAHEAHVELGRR